MNSLYKKDLVNWVLKLNPTFDVYTALKPQLVEELRRLLKELNYKGKKDEKNIKTFVDNLPTKTVVKHEMKEKDVPEQDSKSEDKPAKEQSIPEVPKEPTIEIAERANFYRPTEALWNRMIELTKKIEEIEAGEAERQKREIEEKRNAQVRDAEFLLKMYKEEHERRRLFNDNLKKEVDKLAKKGGKGRTAEFNAKKQEYFQPEKLISESYDSEIIDEVLNKKANELIEQNKDKEFAVNTGNYNALTLAEPKVEEDFKKKFEEAGRTTLGILEVVLGARRRSKRVIQ
jgi:hypothetical protein